MKNISDFKVGDMVLSISDGCNIECEIVRVLIDNHYNFKNFIIRDLATGLEVYVHVDEIDFNKSYYRNKKLESLGIK